MESFARRRVSAVLVAGLLAVSFAAGGRAESLRVEQNGVFALLGGTPRIVSRFWISNPNGLSGILKVRQFRLDGKTPILTYDTDMEHLMHLVIVRDDFATFAHLHPDYDRQTGTFWQRFTKDPNHQYYVYADTTPRDIGQQVFRFTLDDAPSVALARLAWSPSARDAAAGQYVVRLSQTTISANRAQNLDITVLRGGKPADDLVPYLGAAAHVVIIDTTTLSYVHVHPTLRGEAQAGSSMSGMSMAAGAKAGPFMEALLPPLPAGSYKVWIEIMGGDNVYTAPFTILAR